MANPTVEKLKALGIRHGEKAAVGIAATIFLVSLGAAFAAKSNVQVRPEEITADASRAEQNISKPVAEDVVLERITEEGIKDVDLTDEVKNQKVMKADQFSVAQGWTAQEPGAGLIRETPGLIAPRDIVVRANRGGLLVYALDANNKRIIEEPKAGETRRRNRPARRSTMSMPGMSGMPGGGGGTRAGGRAEAEQKKKDELAQKQLKAALAGGPASKKDKDKEPEEELGPPEKEITEGYRSVMVTAILDHKAMRDAYVKALKLDISQAHPKYLRVDAERREQGPDGKWSEWALVDRASNDLVLQNLPEIEEEMAPPDVIMDALVDHLPFLRAGLWQAAHRSELVPEEKQTIQPRQPMGGGYGEGMPGMMGGRGGGMSMPGGGGEYGGSGGMMAMGGMPGMMGGRGGGMSMPGGGYGEGMPGMMGGYGGSMGGGDVIDFPTSQANELMVRVIDFTVVPDVTYQYRLRVVVQNPNWNKEKVAADVDRKSKELFGKFSEPSAEVTVPGDLTAYVVKKAEPEGTADPRNDKVEFRIAKWLTEDGQTVVKPRGYGPGEIIGEQKESVVVPTDGEGTKVLQKDLTSHLLVTDTDGGKKSVASLGMVGGDIEVPAQALILRPDGSLVLRSQARDTADQEMRDVYEANLQAIKDAKKKREPGQNLGGMSGPGGMPGYGGGGGGMPGIGGRPR